MTSSFAARRVPNRIPWSRSTFIDPMSGSVPATVVLWAPWADLTDNGDTAITLRGAEPKLSYVNILEPSARGYSARLAARSRPPAHPNNRAARGGGGEDRAISAEDAGADAIELAHFTLPRIGLCFPRAFGHRFHEHSATRSTVIRPVCQDGLWGNLKLPILLVLSAKGEGVGKVANEEDRRCIAA